MPSLRDRLREKYRPRDPLIHQDAEVDFEAQVIADELRRQQTYSPDHVFPSLHSAERALGLKQATIAGWIHTGKLVPFLAKVSSRPRPRQPIAMCELAPLLKDKESEDPQ